MDAPQIETTRPTARGILADVISRAQLRSQQEREARSVATLEREAQAHIREAERLMAEAARLRARVELLGELAGEG